MEEKIEKIIRSNKKRLWYITGAALGGNLIMILSFIYYSGVKDENINGRIFKSAEERAVIINHVKNAPNPLILDAMIRHTTQDGVHMPKESKDSTYVKRKEWEDWIKNNAYDVYKMKQNTDKTLQIQREQNRMLDAIVYKLDKLEDDRK